MPEYISDEYYMLAEKAHCDRWCGCGLLVRSDSPPDFAMRYFECRPYECYMHLYRCCGHSEFLEEMCGEGTMRQFLSDTKDGSEFLCLLSAVLLSKCCTGALYDRLFNIAYIIKKSMKNHLYRHRQGDILKTLSDIPHRLSPQMLIDLIVCMNCFLGVKTITGMFYPRINIASSDIERAISAGAPVPEKIVDMLEVTKNNLSQLRKIGRGWENDVEIIFTTRAKRSNSELYFETTETSEVPESYVVKFELFKKNEKPADDLYHGYYRVGKKEYCQYLPMADVHSMGGDLTEGDMEQLLNICAHLDIPLLSGEKKLYLRKPAPMLKSAKK